MSKKDEFKNFASKHPELNDYVASGNMSWQKFYEMYDIYGEDDRSWSKYLKKTNNATSSTPDLSSLPKIIQNIDMNSIQEHINTAQKALGVIQELTTKNKVSQADILKGPTTSRPINKFFED